MRLSQNFILEELLASQTAERAGGEMLEAQLNPRKDVVDHLERLVDSALQPLRTLLQTPFTISSGYRCELLNAKIGGSKESQHCQGEASDIVLSSRLFTSQRLERVVNILNYQIHDVVGEFPRADVNASFYLFAAACLYAEDCDADQIIHEFGSDGKPGWVHLSVGSRKRRQILAIGGGSTRSLNLEQALALGC